MSHSRDLVPVPKGELVPVKSGDIGAVKRATGSVDPLKLVPETLRLHDREEVRNFLPDILGRALARIWIDTPFADLFSRDPKAALEAAGVFLPDNISIEFSKGAQDRPKIIVFEQQPGSKFKLRVFYLQLVMMAGK